MISNVAGSKLGGGVGSWGLVGLVSWFEREHDIAYTRDDINMSVSVSSLDSVLGLGFRVNGDSYHGGVLASADDSRQRMTNAMVVSKEVCESAVQLVGWR
jgi:hypothetical protein